MVKSAYGYTIPGGSSRGGVVSGGSSGGGSVSTGLSTKDISNLKKQVQSFLSQKKTENGGVQNPNDYIQAAELLKDFVDDDTIATEYYDLVNKASDLTFEKETSKNTLLEKISETNDALDTSYKQYFNDPDSIISSVNNILLNHYSDLENMRVDRLMRNEDIKDIESEMLRNYDLVTSVNNAEMARLTGQKDSFGLSFVVDTDPVTGEMLNIRLATEKDINKNNDPTTGGSSQKYAKTNATMGNVPIYANINTASNGMQYINLFGDTYKQEKIKQDTDQESVIGDYNSNLFKKITKTGDKEVASQENTEIEPQRITTAYNLDYEPNTVLKDQKGNYYWRATDGWMTTNDKNKLQQFTMLRPDIIDNARTAFSKNLDYLPGLYGQDGQKRTITDDILQGKLNSMDKLPESVLAGLSNLDPGPIAQQVQPTMATSNLSQRINETPSISQTVSNAVQKVGEQVAKIVPRKDFVQKVETGAKSIFDKAKSIFSGGGW